MKTTLRPDIQALRGLAVLIIVLFHASIGPFKAGYLGVDIFFVISGFLITGLLIRSLEAGNFSFKEFYIRRAKRLLPAAFVTLLLTAIGSYFFLTISDFNDFKDQVIGSLTFTTNMTLLYQSGYFEGASKAKPLLHMWSLAVEEQFYMLVPLALFFTPQRFWKLGALAGIAASLVACILVYQHNPDMAFFTLPTRAWELGIGAAGALYSGHKALLRPVSLLFWPALAALMLIPVFPLSSHHPGLDAALVCLATLIVILRGVPDGIWMKPLSKLGDYSYSLYLVHWPLFAFATNAYMEQDVPLDVRLALLGLSLGLAMLLYHLVEKPIHRAHITNYRPLVAGFFIGAIVVIGLTMVLRETYQDAKIYKEIRRTNIGLGVPCKQDQRYIFNEACQTGGKPEILVWGDSHAMHLVAGVLSQAGESGVLQATKSGCSPLLGLDYAYPRQAANWGETCVRFNNEVLAKLADTPSLKLVILSSAFNALPEAGDTQFEKEINAGSSSAILTPDLAVSHLAQTAQQIRALGKRVVLVSSPPRSGFNTGSCLERQVTGKISLGPNAGCRIAMTPTHALPPELDGVLQRLPQEAKLNVIELSDDLCGKDECKTMLNGKWIYRDGDHLSYEGSEEVFKEFKLMQQITQKAY